MLITKQCLWLLIVFYLYRSNCVPGIYLIRKLLSQARNNWARQSHLDRSRRLTLLKSSLAVRCHITAQVMGTGMIPETLVISNQLIAREDFTNFTKCFPIIEFNRSLVTTFEDVTLILCTSFQTRLINRRHISLEYLVFYVLRWSCQCLYSLPQCRKGVNMAPRPSMEANVTSDD